MDNRTNTIAGWVLAGGIAALGLSIVGGMMFKSERPEKMGYPIEGVENPDEHGAKAEEPIANLLAKGDAAKGEQIFKNCTSCHTITQGGATLIGPNLYGTMGEAIATGKGGFLFSEGLKKVGGTWDFDTMNAWLKDPKRFAPGTKMTFAGLSDPQERADLMLYINAQSAHPIAVPIPAEAPAAADNGTDANAAAADPGNLSNEAQLTPAAPSKDPQAKIQAEKKL